MNKLLPMPGRMRCSCCGGETIGRQWHNRDTGWGLCVSCIDFCKRNETEESFARLYGEWGVHYDIQGGEGEYTATYKGFGLVDIPSGMGGVLPAAVSKDNGENLTVICLHAEYFPNWVLTVDKSQVKQFSYKLDDNMKKIIDSRIPG